MEPSASDPVPAAQEGGPSDGQFVAKAFNPYRPELHYMRGPGPACARRLGTPVAFH